MTEDIFGANIIENLTTGMYQDSKVIYREYIQNSCDQIDKAIKEGLLALGDGSIGIWLDHDKRKITIEDNATGIPAADFQRTLRVIAGSDKRLGEDKGFRGIGRLCGLAYCDKLVFTTSAKGEDAVSIMECNAKKMREMIDENLRDNKYTATEVLNAINHFYQEKTEDIDSHFFRVELIGINQENTDLLDFQQVKDYLAFVAPVPYQNSFIYRSEVYNHAKVLKVKIDEYKITLNGEPIFKKYTTILKDTTGNKYDEIFGVHFKDFYNEDGSLLAWMWVGLSTFQKAIPKNNQMRGLRLRKENIQIGGEDALQKLFKQDRGNSYFIGEVFAIDKNLIPNSQRDYFNENIARAVFERQLRQYFNEELHRVYYNGSAVNSAYKKIDYYEEKKKEFEQKETAGEFVDYEHRQREKQSVYKSQKAAEDAQKRINKIKENAGGLMQKVINRIEIERPKNEVKSIIDPSGDTKPPFRTDKLSKYSRNERKLISKIFSIILSATDSKTAELIISKIEEGLQ